MSRLMKNRIVVTSLAVLAGVAILTTGLILTASAVTRPAAKPVARKPAVAPAPEPASIIAQADPQGDPSNPVYTFNGSGRAHGVGLCMDGVQYRALAGQGYVDIINYYYTNVQITPTDDNRPIRVQFPNGSVQTLSMRDLLLHLTEEPDTYPPEGLKVLAVAARTYTLSAIARGRHAGQGFDICSSGEHCQAFSPTKDLSKFPNWNAAVDLTAGQTLFSGGQVIVAAFCGSCGGHTENNEDIWTNQAPIPYLRGKEDTFCSQSPRFGYGLSLRKSDLQMRLNASPATRIGNLDWIDLSDKTPGGRVRTAKIVGSMGTKTVPGKVLQDELGFRNNKFDIQTVKIQATN